MKLLWSLNRNTSLLCALRKEILYFLQDAWTHQIRQVAGKKITAQGKQKRYNAGGDFEWILNAFFFFFILLFSSFCLISRSVYYVGGAGLFGMV